MAEASSSVRPREAIRVSSIMWVRSSNPPAGLDTIQVVGGFFRGRPRRGGMPLPGPAPGLSRLKRDALPVNGLLGFFEHRPREHGEPRLGTTSREGASLAQDPLAGHVFLVQAALRASGQ